MAAGEALEAQLNSINTDQAAMGMHFAISGISPVLRTTLTTHDTSATISREMHISRIAITEMKNLYTISRLFGTTSMKVVPTTVPRRYFVK